MDDNKIEFYCPSCSNFDLVNFDPLLSPGETGVECQKCGIKWRVVIRFFEDEDDPVVRRLPVKRIEDLVK